MSATTKSTTQRPMSPLLRSFHHYQHCHPNHHHNQHHPGPHHSGHRGPRHGPRKLVGPPLSFPTRWWLCQRSRLSPSPIQFRRSAFSCPRANDVLCSGRKSFQPRGSISSQENAEKQDGDRRDRAVLITTCCFLSS